MTPIRISVFVSRRFGWRKFRPLLHQTLLTLTLTALLPAALTVGQMKFSPDDPAVRAIAEKAVKALDNAKSKTPGELALGALAIVECTKRYEERIPRESPTVKAAIDTILGAIPTGEDLESGLGAENEIYYPAIALILLAEVDDEKYAKQIETLIQIVSDRQRPNGGYSYLAEPTRGDTSQVQYAALALFVARQHRFYVDPEVASRILVWLARTQTQNGNFVYTLIGRDNNGFGRPRYGQKTTPSIQAAGIGTVYLLADLLQLNPRTKSMSQTLNTDGLILPPGVSIYVKPKNAKEESLDKERPLVNFDRGLLNNCERAGNKAMEGMYSLPIRLWNYYYLYAFERYAYFREQSEGDVGNANMKAWYDTGVTHLKQEQTDGGMFPEGSNKFATNYVNTAFAVLFLVRSSEILVQPSASGRANGGQGFDEDTEIRESAGGIKTNNAQQSLDSMMDMMSSGDLDNSDLEDLAASMKQAIQEFRNSDSGSRGNVEAFLRTMIADRNYFRRLIAVRFLAGEQNLDNVPALLYALGDPDFRIAYEAHNGLRLISRKIDSISLSRKAVPPVSADEEERERAKLEYRRVKDSWTDWFLKLRPDAKLLD